MDWRSGFGWGNRMGSQVQWEPQAGMGEGGGGGEEHQAWARDGSQLSACGFQKAL